MTGAQARQRKRELTKKCHQPLAQTLHPEIDERRMRELLAAGTPGCSPTRTVRREGPEGRGEHSEPAAAPLLQAS